MRRHSKPRPALLLAPLALVLAGCTHAFNVDGVPVTLPQSNTRASETTTSTAAPSIVVLYEVQCGSCRVAYATEGGVSGHRVEGSREFRVPFHVNRAGVSLALEVTPDEGTVVDNARIQVGNSTVAEAGGGLPGEQVVLSTVVQ